MPEPWDAKIRQSQNLTAKLVLAIVHTIAEQTGHRTEQILKNALKLERERLNAPGPLRIFKADELMKRKFLQLSTTP